MVVRNEKRKRKYFGTRRWGVGNIKNARGAGDRGGVGKGGRKHKWTLITAHFPETISKKGFVRWDPTKDRNKEITLDRINALVSRSSDKSKIELKDYKVLSNGIWPQGYGQGIRILQEGDGEDKERRRPGSRNRIRGHGGGQVGPGMQNSLNIAFYTDSFLPAVDGVVSSILGFKKELEHRGHKVHVFASGNGKMRKDIEDKYDNVHIFRGVKFKKYPQYNIAIFPFDRSVNYKEMDLIHAHTPFMMGNSGMITAKVNRLPLVGTFHTMFTDKSVIKEYTASNGFAQRVASKYAWDFARFFYNRCDAVVSPSSTIGSILEKEGIDRVTTIPNGIDLKRFRPSNSGRKLRHSMGIGGLGEGGALSRQDEQGEEARDADKRGHASQEEGLQVHNRRIRPRIPPLQAHGAQGGPGGHNEVPGLRGDGGGAELLFGRRRLLIPSTFETQGMVALEAMATGKPVVGADKLALSGLIKNGKNGKSSRPEIGEAAQGK